MAGFIKFSFLSSKYLIKINTTTTSLAKLTYCKNDASLQPCKVEKLPFYK